MGGKEKLSACHAFDTFELLRNIGRDAVVENWTRVLYNRTDAGTIKLN
jgi:hypothetical protein